MIGACTAGQTWHVSISPGIFDLIKIGQNMIDPDVIRTRSLLIWSQTRYRCATESKL